MSCRATQDGWIIGKSCDKNWSTGGGNGSPLQYFCHAELRGTLEAAPVCDGVHDDVGTAHLQARLLAPAFLLQGRESEGTEALAEKGRLGWSNGWDGAEVYTLDRLGDKFCHDFLSHHGKPPILSELQFLCLKHLTNGTTSLHSLIHQFLL